MHELTVIGLGASDFDQLQLGVYKQLKNAKKYTSVRWTIPY